MLDLLTSLLPQCAPGVAPTTMRALIQHESGNKLHAIGSLVRSPSGARMHIVQPPRDMAEAKSWARWLLLHGYNFDVGVAQINSVHFERFGLTVDSMFDGCKNISAGATILQECFSRAYAKDANEQRALRHALSCYNSGNFVTGFKNGYVKTVTAKAINLRQSTLTSPRLLGTQKVGP
jgi:type IV secretion system protein VirB1